MKQRIITAIIALIIVLPIILYGSWPFVMLTYVLAAIALYEFIRMFIHTNVLLHTVGAIIFLWLIMLSNQHVTLFNKLSTVHVVLAYMIMLLLLMVITKNKFSFDDASRLFLATLFIGLTFQYIIFIRLGGLAIFLFILFVIWATDTGAYLIGMSIGKRKLWPQISPNKTIGGAVGGIIFALLFASLFQLFFPLEKSFMSIIAIALFISIFGLLGDLVASAIKRHYKIKDFGTLFPGHGGVFDRLDSFIFVLLVLQLIGYF